jgi:indolepyruvate decarboxylase
MSCSVIFVLNNSGYQVERAVEENPDWVYNDLAPWTTTLYRRPSDARTGSPRRRPLSGNLRLRSPEPGTRATACYIKVVGGRMNMPAGLALAKQHLDAIYGNG